MFDHQITDRPAATAPVWVTDLNKINNLPDVAIVAVVQSIDLSRLSPPTFHAIVAMVDKEAKRRKHLNFNGSNKK